MTEQPTAQHRAPPLRAVVFDWGGTITPWDDTPWERRWYGAGARLAPADPLAGAAALADAERAIWSAQIATGRVGSILDVPRNAASALGLAVSATDCQDILAAHLAAMQPHIHARPDARPTLVALRARGLATGLLTMSHWPRSWHERLFTQDGLAPLLDVCIYGRDGLRAKPYPDGFRAVLDALGVAPAQAVFVGDSPRGDIRGAQAVGMRTIWIPNSEMPANGTRPDARITELGQVVDVVDGWLAAAARPAIAHTPTEGARHAPRGAA